MAIYAPIVMYRPFVTLYVCISKVQVQVHVDALSTLGISACNWSRHFINTLCILLHVVSECKVLWGERSSIYDMQTKCEEGSDKKQSNKTGHAALSACVGDLTFSCKDVASPSTQFVTETC